MTKGIIYFDGLCLACSTEINHYRKQVGAENFSFVDITESSFNAEAHGLDPKLVHKFMHVRDKNGTLQQGVEAFRTIWKELPRYHFLYTLSNQNWMRAILNLGYKAFVVLRPYLPRKKENCSASPYCEIEKKDAVS